MYYYRLLTIPLFTILPRPQPFASRKPTCAGSPRILLLYYFTILLFYYFTILLFYYFTILLFYYFTTILPRPQPFASRKPTCAGPPRILLFYYFTSTTSPAVCISETDLRRFTQDFTILLFYYFSTVLFYYVLFYC